MGHRDIQTTLNWYAYDRSSIDEKARILETALDPYNEMFPAVPKKETVENKRNPLI